jgi:hypothetical protein
MVRSRSWDYYFYHQESIQRLAEWMEVILTLFGTSHASCHFLVFAAIHHHDDATKKETRIVLPFTTVRSRSSH